MATREREMTLAKPVSAVWLNEGQQERQRDRERGVSFVINAHDSVPRNHEPAGVLCVLRGKGFARCVPCKIDT